MGSYRRQLCLLFAAALCALAVAPIAPATAQVLDCDQDECPLLEDCNTDDCRLLEDCNTDGCETIVCSDPLSQPLDECVPVEPPPIDPEALLCTPDDLFADPPVVSTLTVSGYGGVDINECRIASDDDPVMVCLENFGVPVPGSCLGHMQEGPSMTVACTPGSWQTVTRVIGLGVEHSAPTVIVDPLDCWTPPPGRP